MKDNEKIIYEKISHFDALIKNISNIINKPYDFFKLIFVDKIIRKIISNSNDYKNLNNEYDKKINEHKGKTEKIEMNKNEIKKNKTTRSERMGKITKEKFEIYIAWIIRMDIINLPENSDYWDNDPLLKFLQVN